MQGFLLHESINLPAHTFYPSRVAIASLFASTPLVIIYCGSSQGRGTRCAGWLRDAVKEAGNTVPEVKILTGGIKGFISQYAGREDLLLKLPDEVKE